MTPLIWNIHAVIRVTDGDTIRVQRNRLATIDGHTYEVRDVDPRGIPIRLVWVDTPERGQPGHAEARTQLAAWLNTHVPLRVAIYEGAGWDRLLGDVLDPDGNSASQHLIRDRGWPVYGVTT